MARPPSLDQVLDDVLTAPEFSAWQTRMVGQALDAETLDPLLEQFRQDVAPRLASLEPEAREQAEKSLIAALVAEASRTMASAGPLPSPVQDLGDRIITRYPQPIATAYLASTNADSDAAAFGCLLDTFESLIHYLATVALSAYLRAGLPDPDLNQRLAEQFLLSRGLWSTGMLMGLLRDGARAVSADPAFPYTELSVRRDKAQRPSGCKSHPAKFDRSSRKLSERRWR